MSYIPDCRTDDTYNQKYLTQDRKIYIAGYDTAVEEAGTFFENIDCYIDEFDVDSTDINLAYFLEHHEDVREKLTECLADWLEMHRNEIITSLIDDMSSEEFDRIKAEVDDAENAGAANNVLSGSQ